MKTNPHEKLVTCERCGTKNLTERGVKAHIKSKHCRDAAAKLSRTPEGAKELTFDLLESLPVVRRVGRAKPVTLDVLETQIRDLLSTDFSREQMWRNEAVYDRVAIGLCLLKGRELHLRQGETQFKGKRCGNVSTPSAKAEEKADAGFIKWIEGTFPAFSPRTARNYMNGARNCGLTSDHGLEDVEALKTAQALHGKTARELYTLADTLKEKGNGGGSLPPEQLDLFADAQNTLFQNLDVILALRDHERNVGVAYEATVTRLRATLEGLTMCKWGPLGSAPEDAEHGEVRRSKTAKAAKAAKGKGAKRK